MSASAVICDTTQVLGKRRTTTTHFLNFFHPPEPTYDSLPGPKKFPEPFAGSSKNGVPVIINGKLQANTKKRYQCTHSGCEKAYSKPSRLAEHERSHTGEVCPSRPKFSSETHSLLSVLFNVIHAINPTFGKPISMLMQGVTCQKHHGPSYAIRQDVKSASGRPNISMYISVGTEEPCPSLQVFCFFI